MESAPWTQILKLFLFQFIATHWEFTYKILKNQSQSHPKIINTIFMLLPFSLFMHYPAISELASL